MPMPRFLADENFPGDAVRALRERGNDVAWICEDSPGAADAVVLARSLAESRVLLTLDKDFGEMIFRRGSTGSSGVILFRVALPSPAWVVTQILAAIAARDDWAGRFSVVEPGRVRMSTLPGT